jgi:SpoVK/Ycf46/Vps4 family AAA+-type ATPase
LRRKSIRLINEELGLLIKSKYPVIFLESFDEEYVLKQLVQMAQQLGLSFFQWSVTEGLRKGQKEGSYYQTQEPVKMLKTVLELIRPAGVYLSKCGLFVFKDFEKYLENAVVLRLFKDLINRVKNTKDTVIILSPTYHLPPDVETYAAHIVGGFPDRQEIISTINETIEEIRQGSRSVTVSLSGDEAEKIVKAFDGLSIQQIRNILNKCILEDGKLDANDLSGIELAKKEIFDREGVLEFCISEDKSNIADFDNLKRWLSERKYSFHPAKPSSLPPPKGILLMGVQGCGKSLAIKVIARELNLPLYRLDLSRLYSKYIGETEQNLRKALKTVEQLSPLCLWIDEIEKGFAASTGDIDGGVSQRILGTFLTWMQERKSGCFLAATANDVYMLPPEFLRKGRFDEMFFVDLPDLKLREHIFNIHFARRKLDPTRYDCKLLAEKSAGFSGAEIEQAIISALYRATSKKEPISTAHVVEQLESTKPLAVIKSEEIIALRDWAKERTIPA